MRKEKIFFHPIDGVGPLTISWSSRPKGDAVEATKGSGVGFFSEAGDLLCVIFDEVQAHSDHQILKFDHDQIEIRTKNGKATLTAKKLPVLPSLKRKHPQKKRPRAGMSL